MTTPTDTPTIADKVIEFMKRYIVFSDPRQADAIALWVLHTHCFDAAYTTPYLYVFSAERGSGKTRVIETVNELVHNPVIAANASPGALYAATAADVKPTIFIDEVDAIFTGAANEDLRGMLNSGYKKNGSVLRQAMVEGGQRVTVPYSTFAPKLLAGIDNGAMPDTIESRCMKIALKRRKLDQPLEEFLIWEVEEAGAALKVEIQEWAAQTLDKLFKHRPARPEGMKDRPYEISFPLLAIADHLTGWHKRAEDALTWIHREDDEGLSVGAQALETARTYFTENNVDRIPSNKLAELMGLPNARRLASILKPYEVEPKQVKVNGQPVRCYERWSMEDAFERYLS